MRSSLVLSEKAARAFSLLRAKVSRGIRPSFAAAWTQPRNLLLMPIADPVSDPVLESRIFWDRYQKEIIAAVLVAVFAMAALGGYRFYRERHAEAAALSLAAAKTSADFQKVMAQYPGTAASQSATLFLAEELRKEKKFTDANSTLQKFVDQNPKHELVGTARMAMAANLESLGKPDEALTIYQRQAASDPHGFSAPIALISEVHLLKEKHQLEEARRICEDILTRYRDSVIAGEASRQLRLLKSGNDSAAMPVPGTGPAIVPLAPVASATPLAASPPKKP